jgi:hypothetical protein
MRDRSDPLPLFDVISRGRRYPNKPASEVNPKREPVGPYTGRCKRCQSDDLWDDQAAYGCNNCGAVYSN